MLKSILRATGILQNVERVKSELEQEANIQLKSAKTTIKYLAMISVWALVSAFLSVLAVIVAICLVYALLAPIYGSAVALGVLFFLLAILASGAGLIGRSKLAEIPPRPPLKFPQIMENSTAESVAERPKDPSWSHGLRSDNPMPATSTTSDPLFNWLFSVARDAAPSGNTGNPQVDQLFTTLKPKAEAVASEAMTIAVERLRHGDRKTMLAILGGAAFVGWLASRQTKPIRR